MNCVCTIAWHLHCQFNNSRSSKELLTTLHIVIGSYLGVWLKKQKEKDQYNTVVNSGIMGEKREGKSSKWDDQQVRIASEDDELVRKANEEDKQGRIATEETIKE
jgi:hypothetical protein